MDINNVFSGNTLKAVDLQGTEPTVTIEAIEAKKFENGNKLVLKFVGKKKALVANKTNAQRIAMMYGNDTDDWIGKSITLYVDIVEYQGKPTEGIRVKVKKTARPLNDETVDRVPDPISTSSERMPQQPTRRTPVVDMDDEIPF